MKKILLSSLILGTIFIIIIIYIVGIRYKDSLQLKGFLTGQTTKGINYHEYTGFTIKTKDKNSSVDIFYIPISNSNLNKIKVKISEFNENNENIDFSFWGLDSINAQTGGTIHFYTKESYFGLQEYRYPYQSSQFLTLNNDRTVTVDLKNSRLYNRIFGLQFLKYLYDINGKIMGLYVVLRHPTNRYFEFEISDNY